MRELLTFLEDVANDAPRGVVIPPSEEALSLISTSVGDFEGYAPEELSMTDDDILALIRPEEAAELQLLQRRFTRSSLRPKILTVEPNSNTSPSLLTVKR